MENKNWNDEIIFVCPKTKEEYYKTGKWYIQSDMYGESIILYGFNPATHPGITRDSTTYGWDISRYEIKNTMTGISIFMEPENEIIKNIKKIDETGGM